MGGTQLFPVQPRSQPPSSSLPRAVLWGGEGRRWACVESEEGPGWKPSGVHSREPNKNILTTACPLRSAFPPCSRARPWPATQGAGSAARGRKPKQRHFQEQASLFWPARLGPGGNLTRSQSLGRPLQRQRRARRTEPRQPGEAEEGEENPSSGNWGKKPQRHGRTACRSWAT